MQSSVASLPRDQVARRTGVLMRHFLLQTPRQHTDDLLREGVEAAPCSAQTTETAQTLAAWQALVQTGRLSEIQLQRMQVLLQQLSPNATSAVGLEVEVVGGGRVNVSSTASRIDPRILAGQSRSLELRKFSVTELTLAALEQFRDARLPIEIICDGHLVQTSLNCRYPITLNPHFARNEQLGFQWLEKIGYIPDSKAVDQMARTDAQSGRALLEKSRRLLSTNITLLAALTIPGADEGGLRLATMVNAWLFAADNEFDSQDSAFSRDPELMESVFDAFERAFDGQKVSVPDRVPLNLTRRVAALLNGIEEIGSSFRIYRPDHVNGIKEGLR